MASTTPSVSFPVRWSSFITIETREPRLILARSVPAILGNLPFLLLRSQSYHVPLCADPDGCPWHDKSLLCRTVPDMWSALLSKL